MGSQASAALTGSGFVSQKREADEGEKPEPVRTHLRNMIIVPEMIGSVIGVYNGKTFNQIEVKVSFLNHLHVQLLSSTNMSRLLQKTCTVCRCESTSAESLHWKC
jgi:ribosomal protein S19